MTVKIMNAGYMPDITEISKKTPILEIMRKIHMDFLADI